MPDWGEPGLTQWRGTWPMVLGRSRTHTYIGAMGVWVDSSSSRDDSGALLVFCEPVAGYSRGVSAFRHDRAAWEDLKLARTREDFLRDFAHPFLVTRSMAPEDQIEFHTVVLRGDRPDISQYDLFVFPVTKAANNPYQDRISVGRSRNCDIVIREDTVSKLHGILVVVNAMAADYTDMGSANGTEINGRRVEAKKALRIKAGDRISFGTVAFELWDPAQLYDEL